MLKKQRAQSLMGFEREIQRELDFDAEKVTSVWINAIGQKADV